MLNVIPDLQLIAEGMPVFDTTGDHIGRVSVLRLGDEVSAMLGTETVTAPVSEDHNTLIGILAEALVVDPADEIPEELRENMRRYGYIRIDTGLLKPDKYAILDEVGFVGDDRVMLKVARDQLLSA